MTTQSDPDVQSIYCIIFGYETISARLEKSAAQYKMLNEI